jgi:MoxR-like ATPase
MAQQGKSQKELLEETSKVITAGDIKHYRKIIQDIQIEPKLIEFIATIVNNTRNNPSLYLGASTRASLALLKTGKAVAALKGRDFVIPEDIIEMAPHVLRHRIMLTPEKEMDGVSPYELIDSIVKNIEVPR